MLRRQVVPICGGLDIDIGCHSSAQLLSNGQHALIRGYKSAIKKQAKKVGCTVTFFASCAIERPLIPGLGDFIAWEFDKRAALNRIRSFQKFKFRIEAQRLHIDTSQGCRGFCPVFLQLFSLCHITANKKNISWQITLQNRDTRKTALDNLMSESGRDCATCNDSSRCQEQSMFECKRGLTLKQSPKPLNYATFAGRA